jgi:hypothetical protein
MASLIKKIVHPQNYLSSANGLILGTIIALILGITGYYGQTALDGVLDLHQTRGLSLSDSLMMQFINWLCISLSFYALAKGFGSKIRLIDIAGILGTIKIWYLFPVLLGLFIHPNIDIAEIIKGSIPPNLILIGLVSALFSIIYIVYAFMAFKVNSHLKDGKLIIAFIAGLVLAEIASKIIIHSFI